MATGKEVRAMYEAYPYPSPIVGDTLIEDVANNLSFLFMNDDLAGKRIMDAGCGTGHRLLGAAKRFPKAEFWGLDMTTASLDTAKQLAAKHNIANARFQQADLLKLDIDQRFDVIVSTGVIHHLEDPPRGLRNLAALLVDDGVLIVWHYHALGEHQRLLDRELLLTLCGGERRDWERCLPLMQKLGLRLESKRYGTTAAQKAEDEISQTSIDIDAYVHPIVNAYRFEEAVEMFAGSQVDWMAINGVNLVDSSKLIDLSEADIPGFSSFSVQVDDLFEDEELKNRYRRLDKLAKLAVIELRLKPNGFTIIGGRGQSYSMLGPRIEGNILR